MDIDRGFVRIVEGLVHYRSCGKETEGRLPLYMIHASPASSITLVRLMEVLGEKRSVIAPDTLGNGDSAAPAPDEPDMEYYAESVARVLDALGLTQVDVYGSHTGAHIGCELAIRHPERVRRLVFDGIGMFSEEDRREFLERYAPQVAPDSFGSHLVWAWHFVRDQVLHFPYFRRTPEYRRDRTMPSPEVLHRIVLDVLKGLTTYHKAYHAAFRHADRERLPLIRQPTFCTASEDDPLSVGVEEAATLVPHSTKAILPSSATPEGLAAKAQAISDFLEARS